LYATGKMTIFGINFITPANDGNAYCTCEIGRYTADCTLVSSQHVYISSSSSTLPSMYNLTLTFFTGGALVPFNFVISPENFLTVLPNPVISSASFAESSFASYSNMVTLFGSNFVTPSQDFAANCTGFVGSLLAQSCSIVDSQTVVLTMTDTDSSIVQRFSLTIQAAGISVYASLPVRSTVIIVFCLL
jgi:hypothetical protein